MIYNAHKKNQHIFVQGFDKFWPVSIATFWMKKSQKKN